MGVRAPWLGLMAFSGGIYMMSFCLGHPEIIVLTFDPTHDVNDVILLGLPKILHHPDKSKMIVLTFDPDYIMRSCVCRYLDMFLLCHVLALLTTSGTSISLHQHNCMSEFNT